MDADTYLERIGSSRPARPELEDLGRLQLAHLLAVPFENLDIPAGRPISLDLEAIYDKIVRHRRGGFCYELNGLFGWLLGELGFAVTMLSARTVDAVDGTIGPEFDHLVLRIDLDEPWLVDVGWGEAYRRPLALRAGAEHVDPGMGTYRLAVHNGVWDLLERIEPGAGWCVRYRFDLTPHVLGDFESTCRWQQTDSPFFTGHRICTLATPDGRRTLMDDRLIVRSRGTRTERPVDEEEVPAILEGLFGIVEAGT